MKNQNENLVKISKSVIKNLDLKFYLSHARAYKNYSNEEVQMRMVKREALKLASNDHELTYLFVDRVIKQINLFLI